MNAKPLSPFSIVFDLDETLVSMVEDEDIEAHKEALKSGDLDFRSRCFTIAIRHSEAHSKIELVYMIKRKGLDEFLLWAKKFFVNIMIWSAGISSYVGAINDEIFGKAKIYPIAVFSKNDCIVVDKNRTKPLSKIITKTWRGNNKSNLFILEDRNESVVLSDKANMVLIEPFMPDWYKMKGISDNVLEEVKCYFEQINKLKITTVIDLRNCENSNREITTKKTNIYCPRENLLLLKDIEINGSI